MTEALPFLAEAYYRESKTQRRQVLINCLWQHRDIEALQR